MKNLSQLNIPAQCRRYNLSLWQCPQFLFLVLGLLVIIVSIATYLIGTHFIADPQTVAIIVVLIAAVLFIVDFLILNGFEKIAEANRIKSEFIDVVSHQLRSPLSNLKWVIELITSGRIGEVDEKQKEYFKILKENIERMHEMVSDLLTVSRIESKKLKSKKEEFSLTDLVDELIFEFQPVAQSSNIEIHFEKEKNLPMVLADSFQIRQVIENLLDNAVRYIKHTGRVDIRVFKKNNNICFEIKDNGVGIPKEDQKYIFQKFFRSENAVRYQTQGSGLGLYISKAIIEGSGGKMWFKSKENKGSTFWFTLPIK